MNEEEIEIKIEKLKKIVDILQIKLQQNGYKFEE